VLQHIRLLILDLDYLVFDCALLKRQALRHSLISMADAIPSSARLPDDTEVENRFRAQGFHWTRYLDIGLDEEKHAHWRQAYGIHENRLVRSGIGRLHSGIETFIVKCRQLNFALALGADASREYLLAVVDRYQLDSLFQVALCTEEFGAGDVGEMLEEIMHQAEVNPSETLALGTRPHSFRAADRLDILTIGCGWGIHTHDGLAEADLQSLTLGQLFPAIQRADVLASQRAN
jgi:phosphoglycolate phosphatase-like HAD superfamily hydrolase